MEKHLLNLLKDLVNTDDCYFDHHGNCQAHGWTGDVECPHSRAKRIISIQEDVMKCSICGKDIGILWIMFNHGPKYNPFRICQHFCINCGSCGEVGWFIPKRRKSRIARSRLIFDENIINANLKGLII